MKTRARYRNASLQLPIVVVSVQFDRPARLLLQNLFEYLDFAPLRNPTIGQGVFFIYFAVFVMYWMWSLLSFFPTVHAAWGMRKFFRDSLCITTRELQTMDW